MSVTKPDSLIGNQPKFQYLQVHYFPGKHTSGASNCLHRTGGGRGDPIHARDFLSEAEDIFGSRKEFQSKDFLCSPTPWGAVLCSADQKVGALGRISYAYAGVYKITSLSRRKPLPNHICQKKDSLEPSSFDHLRTKWAFQERNKHL